MNLWWNLFTLYLHTGQVRVTVSDVGLCGCVRMTSFEPKLTPLFVDIIIIINILVSLLFLLI